MCVMCATYTGPCDCVCDSPQSDYFIEKRTTVFIQTPPDFSDQTYSVKTCNGPAYDVCMECGHFLLGWKWERPDAPGQKNVSACPHCERYPGDHYDHEPLTAELRRDTYD